MGRLITMLTVAPIKDKLRNARRRAALTQGELADKSGVGITTITRIESGHITEPRVSTLRKLATALDIEVRELLD
jgi:transcriptional regulator with XRE-family HTH domain